MMTHVTPEMVIQNRRIVTSQRERYHSAELRGKSNDKRRLTSNHPTEANARHVAKATEFSAEMSETPFRA
jgi:hypothetical protein